MTKLSDTLRSMSRKGMDWDRLERAADALDACEEALRLSAETIDIACDWNISEVSVEGSFRSTRSIADQARAALKLLEDDHA